MPQLGLSRPPTQQSLGGPKVPNLPEIPHPLSRMVSPGRLDVRGYSSDGQRPLSKSSDRPLAYEGQMYARRIGSRLSRSESAKEEIVPYRHDPIPEGVEVTLGEANKTKMPIFGNRRELASRDGIQSRVSSRLSTPNAQARLEIDQIESFLKERIHKSYQELKKRFKDNDPEQKCNVSREALHRILMSFLNRNVTSTQYTRLLDRLGLKDRSMISFAEFYSAFHEPESEDYPRWVDPIQRQWQERAKVSAAQVMAQLKERAKNRAKELLADIPQLNEKGNGKLLKPEFRQCLNQLGYTMDDSEFSKLWDKFDTEAVGVINGHNLVKRIGMPTDDEGNVRNSPPQSADIGETSVSRQLRRRELERKRSLDIEKWLKKKFREGFSAMKSCLEEQDPQKTGLISHEKFMEVLTKFGLNLDIDSLAVFLARCSVQPTRTDVPYRDFLHRFQDRSEDGMTHKVITNDKHRYNRPVSPDQKSTVSALETQLITMFQRDFLALLNIFHKIDRLSLDVVAPEEFRAALESRFNLELTDEQFDAFLDRVPLDRDGNVKYSDFMAQFDSKGKAKSLFHENGQGHPKIPNVEILPRDPTPPLEEEPEVDSFPRQEPNYDVLVVDPADPAMQRDTHPRRSPQQLYKVIRELLKKNYQDVETVFYELDEINSMRLSQETILKVDPEISRGEIRDLWGTFITNTDRTLDFHQFTRHFGFSMKSAAFPNAKVSPPKRGDADFMMRSRKLNCAADMLQDSLRSKIDYMWEELRKEFHAMDPYGTGCVSATEFQEVLNELCVHLSHHELNLLTNKFMQQDDRVSYIEFLKPFALRKQQWRHGSNMLALLKHPNPQLPIADVVEPPQKGLVGLTAKLRQKLSGDWKNLRRAFKKMDVNNTGNLSLPEFRSVLKLANVTLDEDDVYHVMSQFDEDMSGKIKYNRFLSETFNPPQREQAKLLRQSSAA